MNRMILGAIAGLLILIPCTAVAGEAAATIQTSLGVFELRVATGSHPANTGLLVFSAVLRHQDTDAIVAAPKAGFVPGEPLELVSKLEDGDVKFSVSSDVPRNEVTVRCEYKKDDVLVLAPTIKFQLK